MHRLFTTITSTNFPSLRTRIEDFYLQIIVGNCALDRTTSKSFLRFVATSSFDNGSGGLCKFTGLLTAGAERRIMAGQLGRSWGLSLTRTIR